MLKIFHVPRTRSVRPLWLCYELDLPVEVTFIDFSPEYRNSAEWRAISPAGKVPAMIDDNIVMFESGAMVDHIIERYGDGRLQPPVGTPQRALCRQWCWFSEATLIRPLGLVRLLRAGDESVDALIDEAREKFDNALNAVEQNLATRQYMLGGEFSVADVMMGYSITQAERLLDERHPHTSAYLANIKQREPFQRVAALRNPEG